MYMYMVQLQISPKKEQLKTNKQPYKCGQHLAAAPGAVTQYHVVKFVART